MSAMETSSAEQLWYTWSDVGLSTVHAGFRIRAASPGLTEIYSLSAIGGGNSDVRLDQNTEAASVDADVFMSCFPEERLMSYYQDRFSARGLTGSLKGLRFLCPKSKSRAE